MRWKIKSKKPSDLATAVSAGEFASLMTPRGRPDGQFLARIVSQGSPRQEPDSVRQARREEFIASR